VGVLLGLVAAQACEPTSKLVGVLLGGEWVEFVGWW
jgi:hypothetical protein